jgi:hypothetical protein
MGPVDGLLRPDGIARLRDALGGAGFTRTGIAALIGTLVRLFLAGQTEPEAAVSAALDPLLLDEALAAGLVERYGDGVHASVDLDVYGEDWWVVSDLDADARPGPLRTDHVLGIGNAATTLASATLRRPVATALDLGTGCGVQALHLSTHAAAVTATDGADGEVGWQRVSLPGGLRWSEEVDPVALALISGADGTGSLRDQVAVLAAAID